MHTFRFELVIHFSTRECGRKRERGTNVDQLYIKGINSKLCWKFNLFTHSVFFKSYFNSVELSSRDTENLNTEKDYYNDLPGKLPPELLDPVEEISSQHAQSLRKLTIQV